MGRFRSALGALEEPQFRLLFFGRSFSVVGSSLVPVALAFAVFELDGSATDLGVILAIRSVPTVLLLLVGGVWADRLPRNVVMLASDVLQFAVQASVALLLVTGRAELWHLAVAAVVTGCAHAFFNPASTAIVPSTVSAQRLQQANALLGMTTSGIGVLGPAVAGGLVAAVGPGWAFAVDSVTYVISAGFLLRMRLPRLAVRAEAPHFLTDLREGFHEWRARTWLVAIDAWVSVFNMTVIASFVVLGPLVSEAELGGASSWGTILAAFALGLFAGDAIAVVAKPRRPLVLACASLFPYLVLLLLLAIPATVLVIAAGALFAGLGLALHNTLHVTTLQEQVPDETLSRVDAYDWMASIVFMPIGYAIVGPLTETAGAAEVLVTFALVHFALGVVVMSLPAVRRVERRGEKGAVVADGPALPADPVATGGQARQ